MIRHARVDHFAVAASCRAKPGVWLPVGEYNSSQSAEGAIDYIRNATTKSPTQRSAWTPARSFEARHALTEFGARVEARYVGVSADAAWSDAVDALIGGAA
ncbi:hypothetical protein [Streptomyces mirabilis]|uniref:hypothetical protein n=1 Tax=Streptomyces mirabilis TaxID=68239 RepID=UPI0033C54387